MSTLAESVLIWRATSLLSAESSPGAYGTICSGSIRVQLDARVDRLETVVAELTAAHRDFLAAQERTETHLAQLATAQQRTEQRLEELATAQRELAVAQQRTEQRLEALATAQQRTEQRLEALATAQQRTEQRLEELATAQQRTEQRLEELAIAQQRTEAQLAQLASAQQQVAAQLAQLASAQQRTETQLASLLNWQQGESGRREGERFERDIVRGALTLFAGGEGGTPDQPWVHAWLSPLLMRLLKDGTVSLPPEADPTRADLLWRKGGTVAVVEISKVVDEYDVVRAHERAETLRRAGAEALAVVIGDAWASLEVRYEAAVVYRIAWKVAGDVSEAFIAFRRLPP